jgi:RNA polymerase sigma factor (sigma-70 family)
MAELAVSIPDPIATFDDFVYAHRDRAVRVAWRLCGGDDAAAQDVAQDAFVRAQLTIHTLRDPERLEAWFYRVLVNTARNHNRWKAVRQRVAGLFFEAAAPEATGDPGLRRRIDLAMAALTEPQREVIVLVHLEGFTLAQAAALTGRAEGTLKSHLSRALASLRSSLADLDPGSSR